ncbi:unnamed protein product, partial [Ectocarpus sp. 12 AP-2014]
VASRVASNCLSKSTLAGPTQATADLMMIVLKTRALMQLLVAVVLGFSANTRCSPLHAFRRLKHFELLFVVPVSSQFLGHLAFHCPSTTGRTDAYPMPSKMYA